MARRRRKKNPVNANIVATNNPIYERWKLPATQLLDRIGEYENPAFLLVVSAREYSEKAGGIVPVESVIISDDRILGHLIDLANTEYMRRFEQGDEEGVM